MPSRNDSYDDEDGHTWAFDGPYDEDIAEQAISDHLDDIERDEDERRARGSQ